MHRNRLRGMILYRDLTEAEIAEKLGISRRAMSARMTGRVEFGVREIRKLIEILSLNAEEVNYIFSFDEA